MGANNSKTNDIELVINILEYVDTEEDKIEANNFRKKIIDDFVKFENLKEYFKEDFEKLFSIIQRYVNKHQNPWAKDVLNDLSIISNTEIKDNQNGDKNDVNIIKRQKYKKGQVVKFVNEEKKWEYAEVVKYNYDYTYILRNPISLKILENIHENNITIDIYEIQKYKENNNIILKTTNKYGKVIKYNNYGNYDIKLDDSEEIINVHENNLQSTGLKVIESKDENDTGNIFMDIVDTFAKGVLEKINEHKPAIKNFLDSTINSVQESCKFNNLNELLDFINGDKGTLTKLFINTLNKDYISYYNNPTIEEVNNNFEKHLEQSNMNAIKYDNIKDVIYEENNNIKVKSELFNSYDDIIYDIKFDFGDGFKTFFEIFENIELYNINNEENRTEELRLTYRITNTYLFLFFMSDNLVMKIPADKKLLRIKYKGFYIKSDIKQRFKENCHTLYDYDNKMHFKSNGNISENLF